jgi:hypothetical protein
MSGTDSAPPNSNKPSLSDASPSTQQDARKGQPSEKPPTVQDQLNQAELRLKRLGWWVGTATIISAITALANGYSAFRFGQAQHTLTQAQAIEQIEKQRVSFELTVTPFLLPDGRHFYLKTTLKNHSVKELNILMINLRVWQGDGWEDSYDTPSEQGKILVSDTIVVDCPDKFCSQSAQTSNVDKILRLRNIDAIAIEATEEPIENTFGPYQLSEQQSRLGIWLEATAYVHETDQGKCGFDRSEDAPKPGDLPVLCEQRVPGKCFTGGDCVTANAPAEFYRVIVNRDGPFFKQLKTE